uniref:Hyaluronidase n=1 Tax=Pundamilia nyererei TaxID=303518 RepID=A0A3B4FYE2_9CICH
NNIFLLFQELHWINGFLPTLTTTSGRRAAPPRPAFPPLLSGQPFIIFWGIPDSSCSGRPDPGSFGMERDSRVAVFYEDTLGNYPYFVDIDTPINGGLPQHTRLETHLQKMKQDLEEALPAPRYLGLGVLRWGEWVPQWSRSREKHKDLLMFSQVDFEAAAQSVMMETLREVKKLRPKALWGFSPYPSCYNSDPTQTMLANYTGQCPPAEMALNDELSWLWKRSSALYPLLTLEKLQVSNFSTCIHCIDLSWLNLLHIFFVFLLQADLVSSVGESAAMGTAGVVVWERSEIKTERECQELAEFVRKVLGPYSINVTTAARLCSASLCQGRGRCVRQNPESSAYLHLPPPSRVAEKVRKYYLKVTGFQIWAQHHIFMAYKESSKRSTPDKLQIHIYSLVYKTVLSCETEVHLMIQELVQPSLDNLKKSFFV